MSTTTVHSSPGRGSAGLACAAVLAVIVLNGCALVRSAAGVQDPDVWIEKVDVANVSFEQLDLLFDVAIHNPNSVAATLEKFDYQLHLNDVQILSGTQSTAVAIAANERSLIPVPVSIKFDDLYRLYASMYDADELDYELLAQLTFDVPVLGRVVVPVARDGTIPAAKQPIISIEDLKLTRLDVSSADFELKLRIDNPNAFDMLLEALDYEFTVNDTRWSRGSIEERMTVSEDGENILTVPFTLDTGAMKQTVLGVLEGTAPIQYRFKAAMTVDTTSSLIRHIYLPVDKVGRLSLHR